MLVKHLPDYYTKGKQFQENIKRDYEVGTIVAVGLEVSQDVIGKVIYYRQNLATHIQLKNIGNYDLVTPNLVLLIRADQDEKNY